MNRQVPNIKYTIIGDGKVARHFAYYFNAKGVRFNRWHRRQSIELKSLVEHSSCVLLLISDDAIIPLVNHYTFLKSKTLVHFSGVLSHKQVKGCHPLMTFGQHHYDLKTYESMPFVCDEKVNFKTLFPQLTNPSYSISACHKAFYHAMCVMAGNFTQVLMRETSQQLQEYQLPKDILFPYLLQNTLNFIKDPQKSITGPLQRGDFSTISKHLSVLQNNRLEGVYKSFLKLASYQSATDATSSAPKNNKQSKGVV